MNKQRRKELRDAIEELDAIRCKIERIKEDEADEERKTSPKPDVIMLVEVQVSGLDYPIEYISNAISSIKEIIGGV